MRDDLPADHGLSEKSQQHLLFRDEAGKAWLTDVQHDSLRAGVARGASLLVASPTSTGKTHIAVWALARALEAGLCAVYLVTHRALAKQKFVDLQQLVLNDYLGGDKASIVLATGDSVEDAGGDAPANPLQAPLLVATYEKYLALLSASGVPEAFTSTVFCCDEIQLIGDKARGQNVEVLLTLLRSGNWNQFVGLSAVLTKKDAEELAQWLGIALLRAVTREKHLRYECWAPSGIVSVTTEKPDVREKPLPLPKGMSLDVSGLIAQSRKGGKRGAPIIVFCMSKRQTYDCAANYALQFKKPEPSQLALDFIGLPETSASSLLASYLPNRFAIHNADLMDEERSIVEHALVNGRIDIVFATSTLAAGVNFPLAVAIFASWHRWDGKLRRNVPIDAAEFHNMAGRVGRMGTDHESGRVLYLVPSSGDLRTAHSFLELSTLPDLETRIDPKRFDQLALQLIASRICDSREGVIALVTETFSGQREEKNNLTTFQDWPKRLNTAIDELVESRLVIQTSAGRLTTTPVGKAAAFSGLLPSTAAFLITYAATHAHELIALLPTAKEEGDLASLSFALACAGFSTPEFIEMHGAEPTRSLPYPIARPILIDADPYVALLSERVWRADVRPTNAAHLTCQWIAGFELRALEQEAPNLSAGMLRDMFRNLVWILGGFANLVAAVSDASAEGEFRPKILEAHPEVIPLLTRLPRIIRRLSYRVSEGLPDNILWMSQIWDEQNRFRLSRSEIVSLGERGMIQPEKAMMGDSDSDKLRVTVFKGAAPTPEAKANWFRDSVRSWKRERQKRACERQVDRAKRCPSASLISEFYSTTGTEFERAFERVLEVLRIPFVRLDDKTKTGAPDYLVSVLPGKEVVIELKSREKENLVDYNRAVEVLAASEVHGHRDKFCVTLCHPGVDPSVPTVIAECGRLSVVESPDFGEALLRLCEKNVAPDQFFLWLTTPGQALARDLPFRG